MAASDALPMLGPSSGLGEDKVGLLPQQDRAKPPDHG